MKWLCPPGRYADTNVTGSAYPGSMRRGLQLSLPVGATSRRRYWLVSGYVGLYDRALRLELAEERP